MIKIRVSGDQIQEFDEKFSITLDNPTGATIATAKATGVIRNDDLIGTPDNDTIAGSRRADFINGLAGQDNLTGRGGPDRFGFRFGQSRIRTPDRITDFRFGKDSISLVNQRGRLQPIPQEFSVLPTTAQQPPSGSLLMQSSLMPMASQEATKGWPQNPLL